MKSMRGAWGAAVVVSVAVVGSVVAVADGGRADDGGSLAAHGFVALREVDPTVRQDIRYATDRNFTGAAVPGYEEPLCLLTRPAAQALRRAQRGLLRRGYSLTVYDCYRPQRAVDRFVRWTREPEDARIRAESHPRVAKSRLIADGYIAERSGHSRGSAVDVTLTTLGGQPLDLGTPFDFFDPLSHTDAPQVTGPARAHRQLLKGALGEQGWVNLPEEWWHFRLADEPYPDRYFDVPVGSAAVRP
ncbi:M15 family metallopeptidase [Streptomyces sp. NPDC002054]|uniref:M15 family metallopeptidase n=1 Tax=Streptomyces sp. NPDC002054 TaxID=3154663 RepID=UPI00332F2261